MVAACSSGTHHAPPSTSPSHSATPSAAAAAFVQGTPAHITEVFRTDSPRELLVPVLESTTSRRSPCWIRYHALVSYPTATQLAIRVGSLVPSTPSHAQCGQAGHKLYALVQLVVDYTGQTVVDATTGKAVRVAGRVSLGTLPYAPVS